MTSLLAHCSAAFSGNGSLFTVFFVAGFTGGFTHCLSMCGPIVASESATCSSGCAKKCSKREQLARFSQASFHSGRAASYAMLGFFAALLSRQIESSPFWPWLSAFMLAVAGVTFIASSLPGCTHALFKPSSRQSFVRGMLLGFMPCGLLYAAVMMAAATAGPHKGNGGNADLYARHYSCIADCKRGHGSTCTKMAELHAPAWSGHDDV